LSASPIRHEATHIDPSSARLAYTKLRPMTVIKYVQNSPAVPPFPRARLSDLQFTVRTLTKIQTEQTYIRMVSHVQISVAEKPNMARRPKFRYKARISKPHDW
jgi:hypothetical protein